VSVHTERRASVVAKVEKQLAACRAAHNMLLADVWSDVLRELRKPTMADVAEVMDELATLFPDSLCSLTTYGCIENPDGTKCGKLGAEIELIPVGTSGRLIADFNEAHDFGRMLAKVRKFAEDAKQSRQARVQPPVETPADDQ